MINPLSYLFGKTWEYSAGNRKSIVLYWSMFILANLIVLFIHPLVMAKMMNELQQNGVHRENFRFILLLLGTSVCANLLFWIFHGPARLIERFNAFRARSNYCKFLLRGIMTLPLSWHANHHSGDSIDKIEKGTQGLYAFSTESFQPIFVIVRILVCYGLLTYLCPPAGIIVLVMIATTILITMCFDRKIVANYRTLNRTENDVSASVFDAVSNITTVIILRVEKLVYDAISHKIDEPFSLFKKNSRQIELKWALVSLCCSVMMALVLGTYFWQHIQSGGTIVIGTVFLLINYLDQMSEMFFRFTGMYSDVLQRQSRVINAEELARDFKESSFANHVLLESWQTIEVKRLNFSYHSIEGEELHLSDISFSINRGERVALVGESGSGKTTLLKVIRDLYTPDRLELLVDGSKVCDGFAGISRAISLVPQDPEIFATTIRRNITLGAEYSEKELKCFTDMACFSEVVEGLPKRLESLINEKGVNLSGGQQQRLALARGLLASEGKSIILLDEPTSSVDSANELRIYSNIFQYFKGTSIVSSIHRLHLLPLFDKIHLFEKGRIIQSGSFDELMRSCPKFQELWCTYNSTKN